MGIRAQEKRRPITQVGLNAKKLRTEYVILKSMDSMTKFMSAIANSFLATDQNEQTNANQKAMITNAVKKEVDTLKEEVNKSRKDTKEMIAGMKAALEILVGKLSETPVEENVQ